MARDAVPAVSEDCAQRGAPLIVAFAGVQQAFGMPAFEFSRVLQPLRANKIFIRDAQQAWYQKGIAKQWSSVESTVEYLRNKRLELEPSKVVFIGNSMGGFAAILFAALAEAEQVIAFSPQTFISQFQRVAHCDFRWPRLIFHSRRGPSGRKYTDLRRVLEHSTHTPHISLYYGSGHRLDRIHARHLATLPHVELFPRDGAGHNVVKSLRDSGVLLSVLQAAIANPSRTATAA